MGIYHQSNYKWLLCVFFLVGNKLKNEKVKKKRIHFFLQKCKRLPSIIGLANFNSVYKTCKALTSSIFGKIPFSDYIREDSSSI